MFLLIHDYPHGKEYFYSSTELPLLVRAVEIAMEHLEDIESPVERLAFLRLVEQCCGVPDGQERTAKLYAAWDAFSSYGGDNELSLEDLDEPTKQPVLSQDIVEDVPRQIELCLQPAAAEAQELAAQLALETELERQAASRNGETVVNPTSNPASNFPVESV